MGHSHGSIKSIHQIVEDECADCSTQHLNRSSSHGHSHENMNIYAVYLHIFGDFLGSIVVMCTSGALVLLGKDNALRKLSREEDESYFNKTENIGTLPNKHDTNHTLWWNKKNFYHYPAVYDGNRTKLDCLQIDDLKSYTGGSRNGSHDGSRYLNGGSNIYGCYGLLKSAENKEFGIPWGAEIYYQEP